MSSILKDDRSVALILFDLINLVAEQMITQPKAVKAIYEKLPEAKRIAIKVRNGKAGEGRIVSNNRPSNK